MGHTSLPSWESGQMRGLLGVILREGPNSASVGSSPLSWEESKGTVSWSFVLSVGHFSFLLYKLMKILDLHLLESYSSCFFRLFRCSRLPSKLLTGLIIGPPNSDFNPSIMEQLKMRELLATSSSSLSSLSFRSRPPNLPKSERLFSGIMLRES